MLHFSRKLVYWTQKGCDAVKKVKVIVEVGVLLAFCVAVLLSLPFKKTIRQEITADIYTDGIVTGTTTVTMDGKKTRYLVHPNSFVGEFAVEAVEKTCREDIGASIQWENGFNAQQILYMGHGQFYTDLIPSVLLISEDMERFAFYLLDGSVAATSKEVYETFTEHVAWVPERGGFSITGNLPEI